MNDEEFRMEVAELLNQADPETRRKLEGMQWKLDNIRVKYKDNQTGCMIKMFEMMFDSMRNMQQIVEHPSEYMKQRNLDNCSILNINKQDEEN